MLSLYKIGFTRDDQEYPELISTRVIGFSENGFDPSMVIDYISNQTNAFFWNGDGTKRYFVHTSDWWHYRHFYIPFNPFPTCFTQIYSRRGGDCLGLISCDLLETAVNYLYKVNLSLNYEALSKEYADLIYFFMHRILLSQTAIRNFKRFLPDSIPIEQSLHYRQLLHQ